MQAASLAKSHGVLPYLVPSEQEAGAQLPCYNFTDWLKPHTVLVSRSASRILVVCASQPKAAAVCHPHSIACTAHLAISQIRAAGPGGAWQQVQIAMQDEAQASAALQLILAQQQQHSVGASRILAAAVKLAQARASQTQSPTKWSYSQRAASSGSPGARPHSAPSGQPALLTGAPASRAGSLAVISSSSTSQGQVLTMGHAQGAAPQAVTRTTIVPRTIRSRSAHPVAHSGYLDVAARSSQARSLPYGSQPHPQAQSQPQPQLLPLHNLAAARPESQATTRVGTPLALMRAPSEAQASAPGSRPVSQADRAASTQSACEAQSAAPCPARATRPLLSPPQPAVRNPLLNPGNDAMGKRHREPSPPPSERGTPMSSAALPTPPAAVPQASNTSADGITHAAADTSPPVSRAASKCEQDVPSASQQPGGDGVPSCRSRSSSASSVISLDSMQLNQDMCVGQLTLRQLDKRVRRAAEQHLESAMLRQLTQQLTTMSQGGAPGTQLPPPIPVFAGAAGSARRVAPCHAAASAAAAALAAAAAPSPPPASPDERYSCAPPYEDSEAMLLQQGFLTWKATRAPGLRARIGAEPKFAPGSLGWSTVPHGECRLQDSELQGMGSNT